MTDLILDSYDRPEPGLLTPKVKRILAIFLTLAGFSLAHNLLSSSLIHWQFLLQRLYYLPIIMAALFLGWKGGLTAALFAGSSLLLRPSSPGNPSGTQEHVPRYPSCTARR